MQPVNELFTEADKTAAFAFLENHGRYKNILTYRTIRPLPKVRTIFFGDSITDNFPLHEFFPCQGVLNKGIGGDTLNGLYFRLDEDILAYHPEQVVMMAGINGIDWDFDVIVNKTITIAQIMKDHGIRVYLCSITPLRNPEVCTRYQYQEKIVKINAVLKEKAEKDFAGFIDYHSVVKDKNGDLKKEFSWEDGIHVNLDGYKVMADLIRGKL